MNGLKELGGDKGRREEETYDNIQHGRELGEDQDFVAFIE
jgi:hypothetical protein